MHSSPPDQGFTAIDEPRTPPYEYLWGRAGRLGHHALPVDDVPLREEAVPLHDLRITFDPRYHFRRVHLEPEGKTLDVRKTPAGTSVTVPRLDVHAMVVGELS